MYVPITSSFTGSGRQRRREIGIVHSRLENVDGISWKTADAIRTVRVEFKVVLLALQAWRKRWVVVAERVKEQKLL